MVVLLPGISEIVKSLEEGYCALVFRKIKFPKGIQKENWVNQTENIIKNVIGKISLEDNIYFIFGENQELLDVGKASSKNKDIRNRLRKHLIYCSKGTSSKLTNIKNYIVDEQHQMIYIATLRIEPEEYYQMAESFYITRYSPKWNSRVD